MKTFEKDQLVVIKTNSLTPGLSFLHMGKIGTKVKIRNHFGDEPPDRYQVEEVGSGRLYYVLTQDIADANEDTINIQVPSTAKIEIKYTISNGPTS
jgi:hypothetical protein